MKYAVEARVFHNGKIVAKMREAREGEENSYTEIRTCDIYIDVFDVEEEALEFLAEYRRA